MLLTDSRPLGVSVSRVNNRKFGNLSQTTIVCYYYHLSEFLHLFVPSCSPPFLYAYFIFHAVIKVLLYNL